ncbi:hypothetical protein FPV67DRAFT_1669944 [Lyophyllum atratum]|nr:hypothetical protein FPV67DRAFT_1669944 [Lyophyllum atratum]
MRFTTVSFLTCAFTASAVVASNCKKGLYYCGSVLLTRGNYYNQIDAALLAAHQPDDSNHINNSLFFCINDDNSNGNIYFNNFCGGGCQNGGDSHSDFCN